MNLKMIYNLLLINDSDSMLHYILIDIGWISTELGPVHTGKVYTLYCTVYFKVIQNSILCLYTVCITG